MEKKGFGHYWEFMDVSVIIFVVYSLANAVFPFSSLIGNTLSAVLSFLVMIFVFGLVGFRLSRTGEKNYPRTGAYAGIVLGLIAAAVAIVTFYFFPGSIAETLQKAANAGANPATIETFMKIGLFIGLIIDPAIYAAIGALLVWISKFIFKKK